MKKNIYPLNYFRCIFSPRRLFIERGDLSWFQLIFTYIFLTSLLVIPATLYFSQTNQFPTEQLTPNLSRLTAKNSSQAFSDLKVTDGTLTTSNREIFSESDSLLTGANLTEQDIQGKKMVLMYNHDTWTIKSVIREKNVTYSMRYSKTFKPKRVTDQLSYISFLEEQFYISNRFSLILMMSINIWILLFFMNDILVVGISFFLWLTRKSQFSSINTFKESLTMVMYGFGSGSIIAFIIGLIHFDIIVMVGIQSLCLITMLITSYVKTRFKSKSAKPD